MCPANKGTLFGLGVGPGDPKLITIRAKEVLESVPVVFAASSPKNSYSRALDVVKDYLPEGTEVRTMPFPMIKDQDRLEAAWKDNARQVLEVLDGGRDAAFVTIGDSLTYSTFGYLLKTVQAMDPEARIESVPGVTSYNAAAARLNLPLVESKESLMVVSGVSDPGEIPHITSCADNIVIMKTYHNYDEILDALEDLPERRPAWLVSNCTHEDEVLVEDAYAMRGKKMPYLSLIIAKAPAKGGKGR